MLGLLAAALPFAFYLRWPSTLWNFDGVACAAALELGNPVYFFHAQHLLYGFLGFLFWNMFAVFGMQRALPALQLFSSLLSSISLYFLWRLVATLAHDEWLAFLLTAAAGFSATFWTWSVEAQVYPLGILGLAAASYYLLASESSRPRTVGFWHGVAILGHAAHGLWIIPALYWMARKRLSWLSYVMTLALTVGLAYAAVGFFVLRAYHVQGPMLDHWLKGSLGLTADRSIAWHWPGPTGFFQWLRATPAVLWGTYWPYTAITVPTMIRLISGLSQLFLIGLAVSYIISSVIPNPKDVIPRGGLAARNDVCIFSLIWLGMYAAFFSTWEPQTLCYRMTDVIPFTLVLLALIQRRPDRRVQRSCAGFWMASLLCVNFYTRARPMHDSARNTLYQETVALSQTTSPDSVYLTGGGLPWIYLTYFAGRSTWNIHMLSVAEFDRGWSRLNPRPALYATTTLLTDPEAGPWLTHHHLKILHELPWVQIS